MALSALLSLFWARVLVESMGAELYGLFITFLAVAQLSSLGEFGVGGAVGLNVARLVARGDRAECISFLAAARGVLLLLALILLVLFISFSGVLPKAFALAELPGSGSLNWLFVFAGLGAALAIGQSYVQNLLYFTATVVWPILPSFFIVQLTSLVQFFLARAHAPLWMQYGAIVAGGGVLLIICWRMLVLTYPEFATFLPVRFQLKELRALLTQSFWVYLAALGSLVFMATDRLLVQAGFGAALVSAYHFNWKIPELAIAGLGALSYASLPRIALRFMTSDPNERSLGLNQAHRLRRVQTVAACSVASAYLCFNDLFIRLWQGAQFQMPLLLQTAFAMTLAITIAGDAGIQIFCRVAPNGPKIGGLLVGLTSLLNFALSYLAMRSGLLVGIAFATVLAQSILSLYLSIRTTRCIGVNWFRWMSATWLLPLSLVAAVGALRAGIAPNDPRAVGLLTLIWLAMTVSVAWIVGIRRELIVDEWSRLRASFR